MVDTIVARPLAPARESLIGSLLATADVREGFTSMHLQGATNGRASSLFESFGRMEFRRAAVFCGVNNKTFDQASAWVDGFAMAVYGGLLCNAVGLNRDEQLREASLAFDAGESIPVEAQVMDTLFSPTGGLFPTPTDLTPAGGAVKPKVGIAMLEGWFATRYLGAPTLHLPTVIASLAMGLDGVAFDEEVLRTKLGSKVVNGGGYDLANVSPAGVAAPAGEKWIYGTGEVIVLRGNIEPQQAFNQSNNEVTTLFERPYIVAADGPVAAVRVQVTA